MARVYGTKSIEEALKHLLKVADSIPNDPFIWHSIGLQFYSIKCYSDALKYFLRSEAIKAEISASNLFHIGDCLKKLGQIEESVQFFKKALTIPVRNKIDYKGFCESRKQLLASGYSEEELNRLAPKKL